MYTNNNRFFYFLNQFQKYIPLIFLLIFTLLILITILSILKYSNTDYVLCVATCILAIISLLSGLIQIENIKLQKESSSRKRIMELFDSISIERKNLKHYQHGDILELQQCVINCLNSINKINKDINKYRLTSTETNKEYSISFSTLFDKYKKSCTFLDYLIWIAYQAEKAEKYINNQDKTSIIKQLQLRLTPPEQFMMLYRFIEKNKDKELNENNNIKNILSETRFRNEMLEPYPQKVKDTFIKILKNLTNSETFYSKQNKLEYIFSEIIHSLKN